jgi:hypothetical protein
MTLGNMRANGVRSLAVSPFDIVIDDQSCVWVANSSSDTVVRIRANDPPKVETFHAGIGVRALALDSKGNVWMANNMDLKPRSRCFPNAYPSWRHRDGDRRGGGQAEIAATQACPMAISRSSGVRHCSQTGAVLMWFQYRGGSVATMNTHWVRHQRLRGCGS